MANFISGERREGDVQLSTKKGLLTVNETYNYFVQTDNKWVDRFNVLTTPGLPIPGVTISPSNLGVCKSMNAERMENQPLIWKVTATFSSEIEDNSGGGSPGTDPEAWVPVRETHLEPYEEVMLVDKDNKKFVNGAGLPYEAGIPTPKDNIRWDFFQFESPLVTDEIVSTRNNKLNDAAFKGKAKHTLLLKVRRSTLGWYYGKRRRLTEYSLTWKEDNWHTKLANWGDTFMKGGKVYPYIYKSDKNTVVKGPLGVGDYDVDTPMDAIGGEPSGGTESETVDGVLTWYALEPLQGTMYFIEFKQYDDLNFSSFLRI